MFDGEAAAEGRNFLNLFHIVGHDGGAHGGQKDVGAVVDRDVIGDTVDERVFERTAEDMT
jgi:hypothetical protein